ncbi:MAG: DUF4268 domain-containing protein [Chloroflexi bacterium]|nr:DUF4268 domain-containing protein [Chloroflexota bacterium]
MPDVAISTLESVNLRTVWAEEAQHFTPWLAQSENLARLGEALGLTLEPHGTEQAVGGFSADILCRRLDGGGDDESWVVIENQFGRTDHDHLGKLLTYTAGLNARTVVWIAEEFRDEHRAALDLLNSSTTQEYAYFGVEIELLKIDDSRPAPRFNIVVQPNDWAKTTKARTGVGPDLTATQQMQLEFWTGFRELMESESTIACAKPAPWTYMGHSAGIPRIGVASVFSTWNTPSNSWAIGELRVEMKFFSGVSAQDLFERLAASRADLERESDRTYVWRDRTEGTRPVIYVQRDAEVEDRDQWPEYQAWLKVEVERMFSVLVPKVRELAG